MTEDRAIFDQKLQYETALTEQIPEKEALWEAERKKPKPDLNAKFAYAFVLTKSADEKHKNMGIRLLSECVQAKFDVEESQYAMAVAYYTLQQYDHARGVLDELLRRNPEHRYANELYGFVKQAQATQDMQVTVGLTAGVVAAAAAIAIGAFLGSRRGGR